MSYYDTEIILFLEFNIRYLENKLYKSFLIVVFEAFLEI